MDKSEFLIGGIEAGGTSFFLSLASLDDFTLFLESKRIPTTTPDETIRNVIQFFEPYMPKIIALGVASFGPVDLNPKSVTYGFITTTPKEGWKQFDFIGSLRNGGFGDIPIGFDTDVNAAALAGSWKLKVQNAAYVTVGTGVGVGVIIDGKPLHGILHPELGHSFVPRSPNEYKEFEGLCPFHKNPSCVEGLLCASAIAKRLDIEPSELEKISDGHRVWKVVSDILAYLCVTISTAYSPEIIVLGGGVLKRAILVPKVRKRTIELLGGYLDVERITNGGESYILSSLFEGLDGAIGSLILAKRALILESSLNKD